MMEKPPIAEAPTGEPTGSTANKVNFQLPNLESRQSLGRDVNHNHPVYVKHGFPEVFKQKTDYYNYLPKISQLPGVEAEETYGLMYHKPETDAEIKMHDLWIARRRQESFEWKSQQQLNLVLDRLSLHKSRLESDLLRRHESGAYLRGEDTRPKSAHAKSAGSLTNRFAPMADTSRIRTKIMSAKSAARGGSANASLSSRNQKMGQSDVDIRLPTDDIYEDTEDDLDSEMSFGDNIGNGARVVVKVIKNGIEVEQVLNQSIRKSVQKVSKSSSMGTIPMRYRTPIPLTFVQEHYMQLSDSEDEDNHMALRSKIHANRLNVNSAPAQGVRPTGQGAKKPKAVIGPNTSVRVQFKRDKIINRERPISASLFRTLADTDPEFKVLYRYSNYRRMPLSDSQQIWLDTQEKDRSKASQEYAKKLADDQVLKAARKKDKEKGKEKRDDTGKPKKKDDSAQSQKAAQALKDSLKSKYKDASDFMERNFPNFDREDFVEEDRLESTCPMRATQNFESDRVMGAFAKFNLPIRESAVRNALLVPQDYPEAICLEQLRTTSLEGLMSNPIRKELWRSFTRKTVKKGGKKKKTKK